jgi:sugar (pentulose or hexulose) kinase
LKYDRPEIFKHIAYAFHLPQYLSYVLSDYPASEVTSIGCHTNLWNFKKNKYHSWVVKEELNKRFPFILPSSSAVPTIFSNKEIQIGVGLHDSSAALIPYLFSFHEPFVLISTGTWNISLNPFNQKELTGKELQQDCLCYLSYDGKPVKASRLFAGYEHEQSVKKLAAHFNKSVEDYQSIEYDPTFTNEIKGSKILQQAFSKIDLHEFKTYEKAYHHLMWNIVQKQLRSTNLVLKGAVVKRIFVDGGFSKNKVFMNMLARTFPNLEVYAATIPQASALGAAMAIHESWNKNPLPKDIIELKRFSNTEMNYSI